MKQGWRGQETGIALILGGLVLLNACEWQPAGPNAEQIAMNNRGVAQMGHFDYAAAQQTFAALIEKYPGWTDARVNLAIAMLNRQQEGDEAAALAIVDQVLVDEPGHVRADYVAGLLRLYLGETAAALSHFRRVTEADPEDAYAAYYLGQVLLQVSQPDQALVWYRKAIDLDPYLRSAYYSSALVLRRSGDREQATRMLSDYQRFKDNPRARLAEFKYTRMGPKAEAVALGDIADSETTEPAGPVFADAVEHLDSLPVGELSSADIDQDGQQDLFIAAPAGSLVLLGAGGTFRPEYEHPLSGVKRVRGALWGDVDNDGLLDVYFCREGENQLWRQIIAGSWQADTAGPLANAGQCAGGAVFDADHDGDLDFFLVNGDGPAELLNNNLDGSFRALAASQGLAGDGRGSRQVLVADLDSDRDADLIVLNRRPPHAVYLNDRLWQYQPAGGLDDFIGQPLNAIVVGDLDADGRVEIYGADPAGRLLVWSRSVAGSWQRSELLRNESAASWLALQDFDGDGYEELVWTDDAGTQMIALGGADAGTVTMINSAASAARLSLVRDGQRGASLILLDEGGRLTELPPGPGRHEFVLLALTGKEETAESMRSNRSGIGTQVALRHGASWTMGSTFSRDSGPGQSLQPLAMGLAGHQAADFIAINWSDGVFQTELDLQAGQFYRIPETQRQLSSCPVLFAWDGREYRFISDLLGVGGLGFFASPGKAAEPRPWEYFLFPKDSLVARDGRLQIKITEPMEENAYLDQVRMHVYDLPNGWSMILDERMATGAPEVSGEPIFYRHVDWPVAARNQLDQDVTDAILLADLKPAATGARDPRFIGKLAKEQRLTLDFGKRLSAPIAGARPVLIVDGWVEYPYSQTVFAAWQAGESYSPPSLEYRDGAGKWHMLYPEFGYPAGMPRKMALPLDRLPEDAHALRLSSNIEVYWDRVGIAWAEDLTGYRHAVLPLQSARMARSGFPLRTTGPERQPYYRYSDRSQYWDTRYMPGFYTEFGPITELLARHDDALAIIGPGEEVHMEFAEPAPPADGYRQWLVLEARGYAKDMDLYTVDGENVGPLPVSLSAPAGADRRAARIRKRNSLNSRYNTRFQAGR